TIITAATPLLIAALGELVAERSGVLNLGVEGMMAVGAICGFAVALETGSPALGVIAAIAGGVIMASLFAVVTLIFVANQVASGLALTLFGLGVSGMLGSAYVGRPGIRLASLDIPVLSDIPVIGSLVFGLDPITYIGLALAVGVWLFLFRSRAGLVLRSVGDSHTSAHALGYPVVGVRFLAVLFGGACAGLAGGYLSLVYTPQWAQAMTSGRGWIALALVVFATWLPGRVVLGALLFGAVSILQLHAQAAGVGVPSQFLSMLPYLTTILVLVLISRNRILLRVNTPACLGQPFVPDR
ncbi:MAG TPA: ABC transporter permease, partial [Methylomirabilota bacterium]|nr:ABC transporter permease [Methylomirabilota bacterium]